MLTVADVVLLALLAAALFFVLRGMVRRRGGGCSCGGNCSCGGSCAACPHAGASGRRDCPSDKYTCIFSLAVLFSLLRSKKGERKKG